MSSTTLRNKAFLNQHSAIGSDCQAGKTIVKFFQCLVINWIHLNTSEPVFNVVLTVKTSDGKKIHTSFKTANLEWTKMPFYKSLNLGVVSFHNSKENQDLMLTVMNGGVVVGARTKTQDNILKVLHGLQKGDKQHSQVVPVLHLDECDVNQGSGIPLKPRRSTSTSVHVMIRAGWRRRPRKIRVLYGVRRLRKNTAPAVFANPAVMRTECCLCGSRPPSARVSASAKGCSSCSAILAMQALYGRLCSGSSRVESSPNNC